MKKILAAIVGAAALAACTPADGQVRVTIGAGEYANPYPTHRYGYPQNYGQHRAYERRFYARQPTYFPNRCYPHRNVVVRDPYTGRLLCVNRYQYEDFRSYRQRGY